CAMGALSCVIIPSGAVIAAQDRLLTDIRIQIECWGILIVGALIGMRWGLIGIAIGSLPSFAYQLVRSSHLVNDILGTTFREAFAALVPPLYLVGCMALALTATELAVGQVLMSWGKFVYIVAMSTVGSLAFLIGAMGSRMDVLVQERRKWIAQIAKRLPGLNIQ
ncbi:MAG: hypothetical protein K0U93_08210, partial [Gammaproteobacteria bacterium]|nr:hypothetical protein [Gammaproteobacteria bacterium]